MPRILVVRGGAIGDFILTLPAIRLLRENFPAAQVEILGYRHIVALAEQRFYAQATRSIEYASLTRFFIPNAELDAEWVEYFASFQQVISYLYDPDQFFENNLRRSGVKHYLAASPKIGDRAHATQQLAEPLQSLALYLEDPAARLFPTEQDHEQAADIVEGASKPLIAIHPGSGGERKNWPLESWAALGREISARWPGAEILLIGGEADELRIKRLRREWSSARWRLAWNEPLPVLAALLSRCAVFLGHDSGISHLAAAVDIPCLLLFGPTDPDVWAPRNPQVRVLAGAQGDLASISVEAVREALAERLRTEED